MYIILISYSSDNLSTSASDFSHSRSSKTPQGSSVIPTCSPSPETLSYLSRSRISTSMDQSIHYSLAIPRTTSIHCISPPSNLHSNPLNTFPVPSFSLPPTTISYFLIGGSQYMKTLITEPLVKGFLSLNATHKRTCTFGLLSIPCCPSATPKHTQCKALSQSLLVEFV